MRADDDGFLGNPKSIQRSIGSSDDDLKILFGKRFLLAFESGVIVVKHWLINNTIRRDRYNPTKYIEEKSSIFIKKNGSYTDDLAAGKPIGNRLATQNRIEENRIEELVSPIQETQKSKEVKAKIKKMLNKMEVFNFSGSYSFRTSLPFVWI